MSLRHVGIVVSDLEASVRFWCEGVAGGGGSSDVASGGIAECERGDGEVCVTPVRVGIDRNEELLSGKSERAVFLQRGE